MAISNAWVWTSCCNAQYWQWHVMCVHSCGTASSERLMLLAGWAAAYLLLRHTIPCI